MTEQEMLDYPHEFRDCDANSLREYFHTLLETLWMDGEGFDGKRPFGNSCWDYDIYEALVKMGAVKGKFDFDPDTGESWGLASFDKVTANKLVPKLIAEMCGVKKGKK